MNLTIVIAVNKRDLWFCRICVASIRYYYPDIDIFLLKDELNGRFSTTEIENLWNVKVFPLSNKKLGWGTSKTFFLLDAPQSNKYLIIDSDIVFIGPFLERLEKLYLNNDIVVSADFMSDPYVEWVKNVYFDVKAIESNDSSYKFPGYFFNTGQIFVTGGKIKDSDFSNYFSRNYPFWLRRDLLPLVDQSLYNYIFPKLESLGTLTIGKDHFMIWSESEDANKICLNDVQNKVLECGLIHWAGSSRTPELSRMSKSDILKFFEDYYYRKIPFASVKKRVRPWLYKSYILIQKIKNKFNGCIS